MSKNSWRYIIVFLLACTIIGVGIIGYFFSGENIIAALGASTFIYTLSKPIQTDLDEWVKKAKKLKVTAIYEEKEANFADKINASIEELVSKGCTIEKVNILSTKRAVIQYKE